MQVLRILSGNWALLIGSSFSPGAEVWACQLIVLPEEKVEGGCSWFRSWDALTLSTQATGASGMEFPLCEGTIVLHVKKSCLVKGGGRIMEEQPPNGEASVNVFLLFTLTQLLSRHKPIQLKKQGS